MANRKILTFPHPALRRVSAPVIFSPDTRAALEDLITDLRITLLMEENGLALAANQIGDESRVFVISPEIQSRTGLPEAIINASYLPLAFDSATPPARDTESEGCLSFPGIFVPISRWSSISTAFQDLDGKFHKGKLHGQTARCFQHEIDHLDGKLFSDFLDSRQRSQIERLATRGPRRSVTFTPGSR